MGKRLVLALVFAIAGCSSNVPKYVPPAGAAEGSLAVLRTEHMKIERVDGLRVDDRHGVTLTPGSHEIECSWTAFKGTIGGNGKTTLQYNFAAGKKYLARMDNNMFSFSNPKFTLIDESTGQQLDSIGGQSIFKVF